MATLYEYYNTGDDSVDNIKDITWAGQTFTPLLSHKITSVKLKLNRALGSGNLTVSIRATSEGLPIGDDLCSGYLDGSGWDAVMTWREFSMGAGTILTAGIQYAIIMRVTSGDLWARIALDWSDPTYPRGTQLQSINGGQTWSYLPTEDDMFEEWGEAVTPKTSADTGSGVEAKASENPLATLVKAETGSGLEHILDRIIFLTSESGSGLDTILALLGKTSSEAGSGLENSYLHILEAVRTSSETGAGADASSLTTLFQRGETGEGLEQVIARALFSREPQTGAIDLARVITAAITGTGETGSGAEASLVSLYQKKTDSGGGVDSSTLEALFARDDSGSGVEAITLLAAMLALDSGQGIETVLTYLRKLIDSGEGAEVAELIGFVGRRMRMIVYQREAFDLAVYTSETGK